MRKMFLSRSVRRSQRPQQNRVRALDPFATPRHTTSGPICIYNDTVLHSDKHNPHVLPINVSGTRSVNLPVCRARPPDLRRLTAPLYRTFPRQSLSTIISAPPPEGRNNLQASPSAIDWPVLPPPQRFGPNTRGTGRSVIHTGVPRVRASHRLQLPVITRARRSSSSGPAGNIPPRYWNGPVWSEDR
jgi:hypothetical protein